MIAALRTAGYAVDSVYDSHRSLSDEAISALSRNPPRLILMADKDFGEWAFAHSVRGISVVFLRYRFKETAELQATPLELLRTWLADLSGAFTTVGVRKVCVRRL